MTVEAELMRRLPGGSGTTSWLLNSDGTDPTSDELLHSALAATTDSIVYGSVSIVPSASTTLVSTIVASNRFFKGFHATGEGDGVFSLSVGGSIKMSSRINITKPFTAVMMPGMVLIPSGVEVKLMVTSLATGLGLFEGTLFFG